MPSIFLYVAIALFVALLSSRLMRIVRLPNVTGYLLTGIVVGPFVLGLAFNGGNFLGAGDIAISPVASFVDSLGWISELALGFIAFTIGSSFKTETIKKVGSRIILITVFEALGASLLVFLGLMAFHFIRPDIIDWDLVLILSAIASATAPAATLMVIRQYKAKGPLVDTLLPVVALDDAAALILYAILFSIAKTVSSGSAFSAYETLAKPVISIAISLAIGAGFGFIISLACRFFKSRANRTIWCILSICACIGLYHLFQQPYLGEFELSSLLMCMMAGSIYVNCRKDALATMEVIDKITPVVFMMFFVLSGADLDLSIFATPAAISFLLIAVFYLLFRVLGKWSGAFLGTSITHCPSQVRKFLGITLIPQAGVAIGLATSAGKSLASVNPESAGLIVAVILTSTIVYELIGPGLTKMALTQAGEIARCAK